MSANRSAAVALTIAGSDCSGGAGLQADLKTFGAIDVYGLTAVTCVVAEVPGRVARIDPVDPVNLTRQIELCFASFPIGAVKTGLLYSTQNVALVSELLRRLAPAIPLVVDPVMVATSGDSLLQPEAIALYRTQLFPQASLITPNLSEAAVLTSQPIRDLEQMRSAGIQLARQFGTRILIKGGHLSGELAIDLLCDAEGIEEFAAPRIPGFSTHGTGCTYSAAIAAALARGNSLREAVGQAKEFVSRAIRDHFCWSNSLGEIQALNQVQADFIRERRNPGS